MARPVFVKCCCCSLEIGAYIVTILTLLAYISSFFRISVSIITYDSEAVKQNLEANRDALDRIYANHPEIVNQQTKNIVSVFTDILTNENIKIYMAIALAVTIIHLIPNILVFFGIAKKNAKYILPYLIVEVFGIVLYAIFFTTFICIIFKETAGLLVFSLFVYVLIPIAIYVYMWLVVYSHYAILQQENNRGRYDKQPYRR